MPTPKRIKLMADYGCFPLWTVSPSGNLDPEALPITGTTLEALRSWARRYEDTLDLDDPMASGFSTPEEEQAFQAEGARLGVLLAEELGSDYEVIYRDEAQLAADAAERMRPATGPEVEPGERARLRALFQRVVDFERACNIGTHARSLVAAPLGGQAGLAWVPIGLEAIPPLDFSRVVEMRGPAGQGLLFVPIAEVADLLRQAAADRQVPEVELWPLESLRPDAPEILPNSLFELVVRLAVAPSR